MTYRAGIIGCGRIGAGINPPGIGASRLGSHAAAYAGSHRFELVAACDADESRRAHAARMWAIPRVYADWREMIAREPLDVLSICTPPAGRAGMIAHILQAGAIKAMLAEKPLAASLVEADTLVDLARQSRVVAAVNYVRRYVPSYEELAGDIAGARLGAIQCVRGLYTKGVLNNGSHLIDLLRWYFGDPRDIGVLGIVDSGADPTVSFRLRYEGFDAWVLGLDHDTCAVFELDVIGATGRVLLSDLGHRIERWSVDDTTLAHGFRQLSPEARAADTGLSGAIAAALENLTAAMEQGRAPACSFETARAAMAIAHRLRGLACSPQLMS